MMCEARLQTAEKITIGHPIDSDDLVKNNFLKKYKCVYFKKSKTYLRIRYFYQKDRFYIQKHKSNIPL